METIAPEAAAPTADRGTRTRRRPTALQLAVALVLVLYGVAALPARSTTSSDVHRRQAAALADGHLDIRPVPAELRRLADPYDPGQNIRVRLDGVQDLAYADGRLYSAHGLTVPLLLLPSEVLLGTAPPNWVVALACAWCGFLAGVALLRRLRRRFVPSLTAWAEAAVVVALGLCSPVWLLLGAGGGYEAAIAAAFACTMAGTALLVRATEPADRVLLPSAVGGAVLLGLAVGARPTMVVGGIVVAVAAVAAWRTGRARAAAAVLLPYAAVIGVLAWWNLARFGSPTEFGFGYQLSVWDMTRYPVYRAAYVGPNVADYLAAVPQVHGSWPWLSLRPLVGGNRPDAHTAEPIVGVLLLAPVLLVGLACLATSFVGMWRRARALAVAAATALVTGVLALVLVSLPFNTSTMRYAVDFTPLLLLAACAGWAWARTVAADDERRRLDVAWVAATVIGVVVAGLVQLPG